MKTKIISVDFQNDFATEKGVHYQSRPCVEFVKGKLVPYLRTKNIKIVEIISDYRSPRLGHNGKSCKPGEWGYESAIPIDVKEKDIWIKCQNSPVWTRENIGNPEKQPGLPYQNPERFDKWIADVVGKPENTEIILIGLTLDCCILSTAQEFDFRGFKVKILKEATDPYSGNQDEKEMLFKSPLFNWAEPISFEELKKIL